jgi:hypothetical protein
VAHLSRHAPAFICRLYEAACLRNGCDRIYLLFPAPNLARYTLGYSLCDCYRCDLFWIDYSTNGMWLLNTVTANLNPFIPGQAEGLFRQWFQLHAVITIAATLYAVYQLYFDRLSLYAIWFVVAVLNSITAGKWGAGESYFATAIAASCILTGLAFNRILDTSEKRRWLWQATIMTLIPILFLIQANQMFHMPTHTPALAAIARALGRDTYVMIAPQTSCSAARDPERIPYVDDAGVSLLGRPPNQDDIQAGLMITKTYQPRRNGRL